MRLRIFKRRHVDPVPAPVEELPVEEPLELDPAPLVYAAEDAVDDLLRARINRERRMSELAALRRAHMRQIDEAVKRRRKQIWAEYREAEAAAKLRRHAAPAAPADVAIR